MPFISVLTSKLIRAHLWRRRDQRRASADAYFSIYICSTWPERKTCANGCRYCSQGNETRRVHQHKAVCIGLSDSIFSPEEGPAVLPAEFRDCEQWRTDCIEKCSYRISTRRFFTFLRQANLISNSWKSCSHSAQVRFLLMARQNTERRASTCRCLP